MNRKKHAAILRSTRKIHRLMGIFLAVLFLIMAVTGLLLGWKKHSYGIMLPKSEKGISTNIEEWMPLDKLHSIATKTLHENVDSNLSLELDRIDARPDKGMMKFIFEEGYHEIQLDATTGEVLSVDRRISDLIEEIHDGSIVDDWLNIKIGAFKVFYNTLMGLSLFLFVITGVWLWVGPKLMKRAK